MQPGLSRAVLAGTGFLVFPLAVFAPMQIATLLGVAALLAALARGRAALRLDWRPFLPLLLLGAWGLASVLWTIDARLTLTEAVRFTVTLLAGAVLIGTGAALEDGARRAVERWTIAGMALGAILLAVEIATEGAILRGVRTALYGEERFIFSVAYNRATSALAVMIWPVVLVLARRWRLFIAALAVMPALAMIHALQKHASEIALAAGVLVLLLALRWGRAMAALLAAGSVLVIVAWPLLPRAIGTPVEVARAYPAIGFSEYHRLVIWDFAATRVAERPVLGWGMNTARVMPGGKDKVATAIPERGDPARRDPDVERMPLHPHSAPLQLWVELGAAGAILGAAFAALLLWRIRSADPVSRAAMLACCASAGAVLAMSFSVWQSWWLATLFIAAALFSSFGAARGHG